VIERDMRVGDDIWMMSPRKLERKRKASAIFTALLSALETTFRKFDPVNDRDRVCQVELYN
jgi:hypothetical protein